MADGDTVAEKIADIAASKAAIAQAISAKGVAVPSGAKLADLAPLVGQITGGGGGTADTCALDRDTMTALVIPEGTTKIGNYAFYWCDSLVSLTVPYGVTSIGNYAFYHCTSLSSLTLPNGLVSIGVSAFCETHSFTGALVIPSGCQFIGESAFFHCLATSLSLPATLTSIGQSAFYGVHGEVTFQKTKAAVAAMENYPWDISIGSVIHCTDGDLTV